MGTPAALRAYEHHLLSYRRIWKGTLFFSFANPTLFLAAMGLGLGTLVGTSDALGGVPYKSFVAPGLLAAAAMQLGTNEAMWPVMGAFKWQRLYFAQVATPLRPVDAAVGHLLYIATRIAATVVVFWLVMLAFGTIESPWAVLAPLAALLCGVAHATPVMAFTASREQEGTAFSSLNRFVITPLFLFSGTFFPVAQLPAWIRPVAYATPLWHGVTLCRGLTLGTATLVASFGHAGYLAMWAVAGMLLANRLYSRRLAA